ncbi:hypothetical protein SAMN04489740_4040 [Arthrobacter alpinus]|uniref:Uncharacterized protein n=1 Tax=Arthrobacter alpinus TaxID=656366 RepID=A0A1H5PAX9_9MICC|nr:hypothetical protein SAMN04489740_4040 [Arthrobacter alpinus]
MRLGEISFDDVSAAQTFPQEVPLPTVRTFSRQCPTPCGTFVQQGVGQSR